MRKIVTLVIVGLVVYWAFRGSDTFLKKAIPPTPSRAQLAAAAGGSAGSGPTPPPVSLLGPAAPPRGQSGSAQTVPRPSLLPVFQKTCAECRVELVEYDEATPGIVEYTVKGPDRNALSDVLDLLTWPKGEVIKDIFLDAKHPRENKSLWMRMENGQQIYYGYYKVRVLQ